MANPHSIRAAAAKAAGSSGATSKSIARISHASPAAAARPAAPPAAMSRSPSPKTSRARRVAAIGRLAPRPRTRFEPEVPDIPPHAGPRDPWRILRRRRKLPAPANRVLSRPELAGHRLVDDHYRLRSGVVALIV